MAYQSWSVVYGEQPSATKWNILGSNDASFADGSGLGDNTITTEKLNTTVAFYAYSNINQSYDQASDTIFMGEIESYDLGNNYSTSTYKFTAPYDGMYFFNGGVTFRTFSGFDNDLIAIKFWVNGGATEYLVSQFNTGGSNSSRYGGCRIMQLSATNTVELVYYNGTNANVISNGVFEGYLIGRV